MVLYLRKFLRDVQGATSIEYGIIAAAIFIVIVGAVGLVGTELTATFTTVQNSFAN